MKSIQILDALKTKRLGPAAANLLYLLHPTLAVPFNTAIVKGYNSLMAAKVKLGSWEAYLAIREGVFSPNQIEEMTGAVMNLARATGTEATLSSSAGQ